MPIFATKGGKGLVLRGHPCASSALLCKMRMCTMCALVRSRNKKSLALDRASLSMVCLPPPLAISHYSFSPALDPTPYCRVPPSNVSLALDRTSLSTTSVLASDHAAVCHLLFRALPELQTTFFCKVSVGPKCRPALRPNTLKDNPVGQVR